MRGAAFTGTTLTIDGVAAAPLSQSDGELSVRMPAHNNGYVPIALRRGGIVATGEFLYVPPRLDDLPPGFITTVAGAGLFARDYGPAVKASVAAFGIACAADGTLYLAETGASKILRVRTDGTIERITAPGPPLNDSELGDGHASIDGHVWGPQSVAVDPAGNVYASDHTHRIRKIDAVTGILTTIAGDGVAGFSPTHLNFPTFLAADAEDVFFIDYYNYRIRRVHLTDGVVSTVAGTGVEGFSGDNGPATAATYDLGDSDEGHLALDPAGNLYLADTKNGRIRRVDRKTGIITTFYKPTLNTADDVNGVRSLAIDRDGNVYYGGSGRIVELDHNGSFIRAWGNGKYALPIENAPAATTGLGHVVGLAIDPSGNIVFNDDAINRVRRINIATGLLETVAGIGPQLVGETGPATGAVSLPNDIAFDRDGMLLIAETLRLRRVDSSGNIHTIGGTGSFVGDPAPRPMNQVVIAPTSVAVNADGSIEMADLSVIDHVGTDGLLHWIAGRPGICGYSGDGGPATEAALCQAWDSRRDRDGNLFIADSNNNRVRRVDAKTGVITTFAGNGGPVNGYERYGQGQSCGDGGPAFDACINTPYGLAFDDAGNLFLSDRQAIRRVDRNGIITTFANYPNTTKLVFDRGFLYASEIAGVFRLDRNGGFTRLAGSGAGSISEAGFDGDGGPTLNAHVLIPSQAAGIAIDAEGNLYFCANDRIRAVRYGAVLAPPGVSITATATGSKIRATVLDASGHPAPSVRVDFTAPAAGPSCRFANYSNTIGVITDANGVAAASCTPVCLGAGTFAVTVRPLTASATANVTMSDTAGPCRHRASHP